MTTAKLDENAAQNLINERSKTHGEFRDVALVEQRLKEVMRAAPNWSKLPDMMKCSLEMQAHKQARILVGSFSVKDHWDDISGYALCVSTRI